MPIFREYIGVKPYPNNLPDFPVDIINSRISEFHFILGFATEVYDQDGNGTGNFNPNWNVRYFSPEKVRELREKFKYTSDKVKVVLSIGGRGPKYPFNPTEREIWLANAIESLRGIIERYNIDGIDIHYEHIDPNIDINDFADCMGRVIVGLRQQQQVPAINVVSIAPSGRPSDRVASYYRRLYQFYNAHINWVDYQFYSQPVPNSNEFVNLYRQLCTVFDASKLLPGGSTDPADAANMSPEVFIRGVRDLIERNDSILPGAFVWNANDSAAPARTNERSFFLEEMIQALLPETHQ